MDVTLGPFKGVNNTSQLASGPRGALLDSDNGYFDGNQAFVVRPGHDLLQAAVGAHSLYGDGLGKVWFAHDGVLYCGDKVRVTAVGVLAEGPVRYAEPGGQLVISNGGALYDAALNPLCGTAPALTSAAVVPGDLRAGTYGIALAGQAPVTGLGEPSWWAVGDGEGLRIDVPPGAWALYATAADDTEFYAVGDVVGPASVDFGEPASGLRCPVRFHGPAPLHDGMWGWLSRLVLRCGSVLCLSEDFAPSLYDARHYLPFPAPVTQVFPMPTGLFVQTTNALYRVDGVALDELEVKEIRSGAGVLDCGTVIDAAQLNTERAGKAAVGIIGGEWFAAYDDGNFEWLANDYRLSPQASARLSLVKFNGNPLFHLSTF